MISAAEEKVETKADEAYAADEEVEAKTAEKEVPEEDKVEVYKCVKRTVLSAALPITSRIIRYVDVGEALTPMAAPEMDPDAGLQRMAVKAGDGHRGYVTLKSTYGQVLVMQTGVVHVMVQFQKQNYSITCHPEDLIRNLKGYFADEIMNKLGATVQPEDLVLKALRARAASKDNASIGTTTIFTATLKKAAANEHLWEKREIDSVQQKLMQRASVWVSRRGGLPWDASMATATGISVEEASEMSSLEQLESRFFSMKVMALRDIGDRVGIKDVRVMRKEPALIPALMVWYREKYIDQAASEIEDSALDATVHNSAEQGSEASSVFGAIQTKYPLIEGRVFAKMIRSMHKKQLAEQEEGQQFSPAAVKKLHQAAELLIGVLIADSIAISEDTTKSKGATLKPLFIQCRHWRD